MFPIVLRSKMSHAATPDGGPARMLVVDDDPRGRKLLEGYLRAEGHEVRCAPDGHQAIAMAADRVPDVVLLDVMMPGMTGYEVCQRLKRSAATRLCQVMLVTALDGTPDKVEGLDCGADDYVTKPVRRDEFLAKVRALLRVRRILVDLERARNDLSARNRELQLKKTLAESLVHDLKNPLAAILGNLDLLEIRCGRDSRHLVQRSKEGAGRMLKMILNLLDVERLEQGQLKPVTRRVEAIEIVQAAIAECAAPARMKQLELEFHPSGPAWVEVDAGLIRRVLDNLLANAISYSPCGGRIEVDVRVRVEGVEFVVSDAGPGVPQQHREGIFEKYCQVEAPGGGQTLNRGLGLTFCRLVVEAHGGSIWVDQAEIGGACFRTLLPAAHERTQPPTNAVAGHS